MRLLIAPLAALAACSSPTGPRPPAVPSRPASVVPDCFLGDDRCTASPSHSIVISATTRRPAGGLNWKQLADSPCAADALVLSGGDAAFLLCWRASSPRAYHLGY